MEEKKFYLYNLKVKKTGVNTINSLLSGTIKRGLKTVDGNGIII